MSLKTQSNEAAKRKGLSKRMTAAVIAAAVLLIGMIPFMHFCTGYKGSRIGGTINVTIDGQKYTIDKKQFRNADSVTISDDGSVSIG